jgi:D-alanyl-D-alanine carboxypeptidase/D-alanyl-D-alanine-endopeptidase (penicillin-binding protein 4)
VSVLDVGTGKTLVSLDVGGQDGTFIPASNLKLLTSGAALLALGKGFEYETQLIHDPARGRIIVKGAGDPALADPYLLDKMHIGVDAFVDKLVESVKAAGVTGVREVVVDDSVFDREHVHPDWPADQLSRAYCAPVSGANFHANVLNVYVSPGSGPNAEPGTKTEPGGPWITLRKAARTVKEGSTEVWLEREGGAADPFVFKLHGTVKGAITQPVQVTVSEPALMLGRVLADRLAKAGVGESVTARLVSPGESLYGAPATAEAPGGGVLPAGAPRGGPAATQRVVAAVKTPLGVVLERCNVDSENLYAESLLKLAAHAVTGQPGSWAGGTAVVRMQVRDRLGAELASKLTLSDGSGLSRGNRVTPEIMTRWLKVMSDSDAGDEFVRSLPVAGQEGTLRKRFRGARLKNEIRAKSGYIREVRTLSGYVTSASGRRVAFSVLVNNVPSGADARAKEFHEDVVEAVDAWLAGEGRE